MPRARQHILGERPQWRYQDIPEDKAIRHGTLRKLYLSTRAGVESNIALLVEHAMERTLEQEQFSIGWEEL